MSYSSDSYSNIKNVMDEQGHTAITYANTNSFTQAIQVRALRVKDTFQWCHSASFNPTIFILIVESICLYSNQFSVALFGNFVYVMEITHLIVLNFRAGCLWGVQVAATATTVPIAT